MFLNQQPRRSDLRHALMSGLKPPVYSQRDLIRSHDSLQVVATPLRAASAPPGSSASLGKASQLGTGSGVRAPVVQCSAPTLQQRPPFSVPPTAADAELTKMADASSVAAAQAVRATESAVQMLKGLPRGTRGKERMLAKKAVVKAKQAEAKAKKQAKVDAAKVQKAVACAERKAETLRAKENKAARLALLKARNALKPAQAKAKRLHSVAQRVAAGTEKKLLAIAKMKATAEKQNEEAQQAAASAQAESQKAQASIAPLEQRCRASEKPKKVMKAVDKDTHKKAMKAVKKSIQKKAMKAK